MPCDTVYTTTRIQFEGADHDVLAKALEGAGWRVVRNGETLEATHRTTGAYFAIQAGQSEARITATQYANVRDLEADIQQAYGRTAAVESFDRFGLSLSEETKEEDGAVRLTFTHRGF